jgi:hypothetical protein
VGPARQQPREEGSEASRRFAAVGWASSRGLVRARGREKEGKKMGWPGLRGWWAGGPLGVLGSIVWI